MASAEEPYDRWKKQCPREVSKKDLEKVIKHYLGSWLRVTKSGSHRYIVEHPALSCDSAFGGKNTMAISLKSGRSVKGVWVQHTLKAIDCIEFYESVNE